MPFYLSSVFSPLKHSIQRMFRFFGLELILYTPSLSNHAHEKSFMSYLAVDTVIDVGANYGQYSSSLRRNGYKGSLISIEPISSAHRALIKLSSNDSSWHIANQSAVGSKPGFTTLNLSQNSSSSSVLPINSIHVNAEPKSQYISSETVPIDTLDSILKSFVFKNSTFLKIDVQGFELEVLKGSDELLQFASGILIELSLVQLYEGQPLWLEIISYLEKYDFILWGIYNGFTDPTSGRSLQINAMFVSNRFVSRY